MAKLTAEQESRIKQSKNLDELVREEEFTVVNVFTEAQAMTVSPRSEVTIGIEVHRSQYDAGYTTITRVYVKLEDEKSPVKLLEFKGYSPVRGGDYISASMPVYIAAKIGNQFIYEDRGLQHTEKAIEIKILDTQVFDKDPIPDEYPILRWDRSVDFREYKKSEL